MPRTHTSTDRFCQPRSDGRSRTMPAKPPGAFATSPPLGPRLDTTRGPADAVAHRRPARPTLRAPATGARSVLRAGRSGDRASSAGRTASTHRGRSVARAWRLA